MSNVSGRKLSCGYGVFEEARNQGYASEALKAICDEVLKNWAIDGIDATAFGENEASARVLLRTGFTLKSGVITTVRKRMKLRRMFHYGRTRD